VAGRFYLDTSIWRDYFEDRKDSMRPLGEFAFMFLKKCVKEKAQIIVSDIVLEELEAHLSQEQITAIFSGFKGIIVKVAHTTTQSREALGLLKKFGKKVPLYDILHSIIARDEKAVMVTRDRHFEEISIVEAYLPENLL
jgi:predicted nucleic acid-binding protein